MIINCTQSVKLRKTTIVDYFKQIQLPFKTYVDFESKLLKFIKVFAQKNIRIAIRVVLLTKLSVFSKPIAVFRGENSANEFIKAMLKEYEYLKK